MRNSIQILATKILSANQKQELVKAHFQVIEADFIKTETENFRSLIITHVFIDSLHDRFI